MAIKFCASKRGAAIIIMKMARLSRGVVSLAILFAIFLALEVIAFGITIGLGNPLIYLILIAHIGTCTGTCTVLDNVGS